MTVGGVGGEHVAKAVCLLRWVLALDQEKVWL